FDRGLDYASEAAPSGSICDVLRQRFVGESSTGRIWDFAFNLQSAPLSRQAPSHKRSKAHARSPLSLGGSLVLALPDTRLRRKRSTLAPSLQRAEYLVALSSVHRVASNHRCERRKLLQALSSETQLISYTSSHSWAFRFSSFQRMRFSVVQYVLVALGNE